MIAGENYTYGDFRLLHCYAAQAAQLHPMEGGIVALDCNENSDQVFEVLIIG